MSKIFILCEASGHTLQRTVKKRYRAHFEQRFCKFPFYTQSYLCSNYFCQKFVIKSLIANNFETIGLKMSILSLSNSNCSAILVDCWASSTLGRTACCDLQCPFKDSSLSKRVWQVLQRRVLGNSCTFLR